MLQDRPQKTVLNWIHLNNTPGGFLQVVLQITFIGRLDKLSLKKMLNAGDQQYVNMCSALIHIFDLCWLKKSNSKSEKTTLSDDSASRSVKFFS